MRAEKPKDIETWMRSMEVRMAQLDQRIRLLGARLGDGDGVDSESLWSSPYGDVLAIRVHDDPQPPNYVVKLIEIDLRLPDDYPEANNWYGYAVTGPFVDHWEFTPPPDYVAGDTITISRQVWLGTTGTEGVDWYTFTGYGIYYPHDLSGGAGVGWYDWHFLWTDDENGVQGSNDSINSRAYWGTQIATHTGPTSVPVGPLPSET